MAEKNQDKWTEFSVGSVSTKKNWTNPDCAPLGSVAHVTHIHHAVEIMRAKSLRPGLIFDKSRLNTSRILVSWLSPNNWNNAGGFRYGNISFGFAWETLVDGLNAYWVGTMNYKPIACRILLTDQDRDSDLLPYDPKRGDGPWWFDKASGKHYWNSELCLEFMLERSLSLKHVTEIEFVKHHANRCCIDANACRDRGVGADEGGACFIAACCGQRIGLPAHLFTRKKDDARHPTLDLKNAWEGLYHLVRKSGAKYGEGIADCEELRAEIARAVMSALSRRDNLAAAVMLRLFHSQQDVLEAFASVIETDLGLPECLDRD